MAAERKNVFQLEFDTKEETIVIDFQTLQNIKVVQSDIFCWNKLKLQIGVQDYYGYNKICESIRIWVKFTGPDLGYNHSIFVKEVDYIIGSIIKKSSSSKWDSQSQHCVNKAIFPKNEVKDQLKNGILTVTVKITTKLLSRTVFSGEPTFNISGLTSGMTTQTRATQTTIATQNTQNILGQNIQTQGQKTQNLEKTQKVEVANQMSTSHKILETMNNPDLFIVCEGERIPCHKIFLSAVSTVLAALIQSKAQVEKNDEGKFLEIDCSVKVGRNLIRFIYTGDMDQKVLEDQVEIFLKIGEMYGIESLKYLAENKMVELLNTENMVDYFLAGNLHKAEGIRMEAKDFLKENIGELKGRDGWKDLFGAEKDLLIEILEYCV